MVSTRAEQLEDGDEKVRHDLKTLALFVGVYCDGLHHDLPRQVVEFKTHDVTGIHGRPLSLCDDCRRLLAHAFVKRSHCPMHPKPMCKKCSQHCYAPSYRQQIQEVMRYSGRKLLLSGRVDYLFHLLF